MGSDPRRRKQLVPEFSFSHPTVSLCSLSPLWTLVSCPWALLKTGYIVCHFSETVENSLFVLCVFLLCTGSLAGDFHLPLAYNHLLLLFFCSETLAVSALPAVMLEWDLKESVRKEGQGRAAVRYCLQYPLIQWLIPHLPQTLVSPSMSPCLSHLHSCSIANILQSQAPSTRPALPVSSIISPLAVPLRDWTPWGVGLLSPSILFPLQQPLLQGPVIPSGVLTSSQGWMILWDCSGDTASSPRLGARGAHSLLLWPGSHFSVSGDGLAGSGPGLWVLVKFEGH